MDLVEWEGLPVWALLADSMVLGATNVVVFVVMVRRRIQAAPFGQRSGPRELLHFGTPAGMIRAGVFV